MKFALRIANVVAKFMKKSGFNRKQKCFYKIQNDIAFCVEFDSPGGILYTTFYIMPLYMPTEYRYYSYGNRLDSITKNNLPLLNNSATEKDILEWSQMVYDILNNYVFPFFSTVSTPLELLNYVSKNIEAKRTNHFFCPDYLLYRMLLFTHLYFNDIEMVHSTIVSYRRKLTESYHLTDLVRKSLTVEISQIEEIISSADDIESICSKTVENTKFNCFGI